MAARRPSGEEDDEADEGDCCPFASRDVNLALLACASCPPRTSPMRDLVSSSIEGALPNLNLFFDALIIYVLSREWFDLIRIYLFGLYTRPYCSTRTFPPPPPDFPFSPPAPIVPPQAPAPPLQPHSPSAPPNSPIAPPHLPPPPPLLPPPPHHPDAEVGCGQNAEWQVLLVFACVLLLVLAAVAQFFAHLEVRKHWKSLAYFPFEICAMLSGWPIGYAAREWVQAVIKDAQTARLCTACYYYSLSIAFVWTVVTSIAILALRPLTRCAQDAKAARSQADSMTHGGRMTSARGARCRAVENELIAYSVKLLELLTRGLMYSVYILWDFTLNHHLITCPRLVNCPTGDAHLAKMLLFWAICLWTFGSMFSFRLLRWRLWLERKQDKSRKELQPFLPATFPASLRDLSTEPAASSAQGNDRATPPLCACPDESEPARTSEPGAMQTPPAATPDAPPNRSLTRGMSSSISNLLSPLSTFPQSLQVRETLRRIDRQLGRRAALAQIVLMFERALAWVAACALCNAIEEMTTQADNPVDNPMVILWDVMYACLFLLTFVVLNVGARGPPQSLDENLRSRDAVELYFFNYASSFVVSWSFIIVLTDLVAWVSHSFTENLWAEGLLVAVFGPGLTVVLIQAKVKSFSTLCCSARALAPLTRQQQVHEAIVDAGAAAGVVSSVGGVHGCGEAEEHESVRRLMVQLSSASSLGVNSSSSGTLPVGAIGGGGVLSDNARVAMSEVLLTSDAAPSNSSTHVTSTC